jgi:hypothetical protein
MTISMEMVSMGRLNGRVPWLSRGEIGNNRGSETLKIAHHVQIVAK